MHQESPVAMRRCRVESEHANPSAHYIPEPEFIAWRREMEDRYGRRVAVEEASSWVRQCPEIQRWTADPRTLWPVVRVRFLARTPLGAGSDNIRFLAEDSLQARAAQLAGLDVTPGYFLSSLPFTAPVVDEFDENAAQEEKLLAAIA